MKTIIIFLIFFSTYFYAADTFYYKNGKKVFLEVVETTSSSSPNLRSVSSDSTIKYYKTSSNVVLGVSDDILIKLKSGYSISEFLNKYDLKIVKQYSDTLYLVSKNTNDATLDISNNLSLEEGIQSSNPNFIKSVNKR